MKKYIITTLLCFAVFVLTAQQTPAPAQTTDFSIEGATAHIGNGEVIENSLIMFSNGKLVFVGSAMAKIARIGQIIDAKGKHVYPGFVVANSTLGLGEIDAVKASIDDNEIGEMLPHVRSLIAYNSESKVVESLRPNGILIGQITPRGNTISGMSAIVQFDAWYWEDAALKADDGIHLNWPSSVSFGRWWMGEDPGLKLNVNYANNVNKIADFFNEAKLYLKGKQNPKNLPYNAMQGVLNGTQNLYVHANGIKEITDAVNFCKANGIPNIVLVEASDAHKIADFLAENNISVILERSHRLPSNEDDDYDLPFKTAKLLVDKGVTVTIGMDGSMERMSARNLPFYAGTCAAFGLDKEKAVQLITGNAASILGIDHLVGTLEVGKHATLFISEGDALDMRTNNILHAFIEGRKISLETHQTKLWQRYVNKYAE